MDNSRLNMLFDFLRQEPDDPFTLYAIGNEYMESSPDIALKYFEKLLHEHEDYVATYYHAGKLYEAFARYQDAAATYQKGMEKTSARGETKLYSELQSAYHELINEEFEEEDEEEDDEEQ